MLGRALRARDRADAVARSTGLLCGDLAAMGPVDAVYPDLHGAMVSEQYEDGGGEILRRVRQVVGAQPPLVASLDLAEYFPPAEILECGPEAVAFDLDPGAAAAEAVACALWQLPFGFVALQQFLR